MLGVGGGPSIKVWRLTHHNKRVVTITMQFFVEETHVTIIIAVDE